MVWDWLSGRCLLLVNLRQNWEQFCDWEGEKPRRGGMPGGLDEGEMWEDRKAGREGEKEIDVREVLLVYWVISHVYECDISVAWDSQSTFGGKCLTCLTCQYKPFFVKILFEAPLVTEAWNQGRGN